MVTVVVVVALIFVASCCRDLPPSQRAINAQLEREACQTYELQADWQRHQHEQELERLRLRFVEINKNIATM